MNVEYFKAHIEEELEGAKDYIKTAIELKPSNASWAKMYVDMSSAELNHAISLYKMMEEHYASLKKAYTEVPQYIQDIHKEALEMYTECSAKVKFMHELYSK